MAMIRPQTTGTIKGWSSILEMKVKRESKPMNKAASLALFINSIL